MSATCPLCGGANAAAARFCVQCGGASGARPPKSTGILFLAIGAAALLLCVPVVGVGIWFMLSEEPEPYVLPSEPDVTESEPDRPVRVVASRQETIGRDGGSVSLDDGIEVCFPEGALSSTTEVSVSRLDDPDHVVLSCDAGGASFASPVEIRVALPDDADDAWGGFYNRESCIVSTLPLSVQVIDGRATAVLQAPHFSDFLFGFFRKAPPARGGPPDIPY